MNQNRRIKRMSRSSNKLTSGGLNLVSLMDVFTILVFFLLVNSSSSDVPGIFPAGQLFIQ